MFLLVDDFYPKTKMIYDGIISSLITQHQLQIEKTTAAKFQ